MFKLLNRFAWVLSITIGIAIFAISEEFFFIALIAIFVLKYYFFGENFIKSRLDFFANSLKENYLNNIEIKEKLNQNIITNTENNNNEIIDLAEIEEISQNKIEKQETKILIKQEKIKQEKNYEDLANSRNYTKLHIQPSAIAIFFQKIGNYIKEFFSTNLLAKLGGILVFLAVVYFLKGFVGNLWEIIGPSGRLSVGIIIGFLVYFIGVKIHPKYKNEGLILMGTGILINFAVILSGRYLVGNGGYLSEGLTFLFLILNTIFSVLTSLIYKSNTLLIFSFIFAYLNPFIIGAKSNGNPYTLIGYSLIISLGGLFLSYKRVNLSLLFLSFILGNLLFLLAPFSDSIGWSSKIILTSIFSFITIFLANKFEKINQYTNKTILYLFSGTYLFVILNLFYSSKFLNETFSFVSYSLILIGLFIFSIKIIKNIKIKGDNILNIFLFIPLIVLILILFSGNIIFAPFVLIGTLIIYLIAFSLINISGILAYTFFGILAIFTFLFNFKIGVIDSPKFIEFFSIIATSLLFLFSSYYYSLKQNKQKLFAIGTIGTILILAPIIQTTGNFIDLSIITLIIFALFNLIIPLINKNLLEKKSLLTLIIGSISGALFFSYQIYNFGEEYFPGLSEGLAFLVLAIFYFVQAYLLSQKIGIENIKKDESLQNTIYSFLAISISIFSIAMAFVFANHPEIITTTWLFEATILYFFYFKTDNQKIFYGATILFFIGLTKFGILADVVAQKEYNFLISFAVILTSFMLNLYFINKLKQKNIFNIHNILHILGMGIMSLLLVKIIPSTGHGGSLFGISIFISILGYFYAKFNFKFLKIFFIFLLISISIIHIGELNYIFYRLKDDNLEYLKILQYLVSAIIISNYFIWKKINQENRLNKIILIIISIYAFIISNLFIIDLFSYIFYNFTLTIYWGLIASGLLYYGIQKDIIKYRTIGLYFLSLTTLKIFVYDVWVNFGDTNSRILVLGILGVIFIIISTLYTKKYGDNLLKEFSLKNLKDKENTKNNLEEKNITKKDNKNNFEKKEIKSKNIDNNNKDDKDDNIFMKKLEKVNIDDIKVIRFYPNSGEIFRVRSKNLLKIVKIITNKLNKTEFKANELEKYYNYIIKNYKSDLSRREYDKIRTQIKDFIELGGKVELVKKG